jgi:ferredoxin-like protein FixX
LAAGIIERIVQDHRTGCSNCVHLCPTNVFEIQAGGPTIARQQDGLTCLLLALYCKACMLDVAPLGRATPSLFWRQGELRSRGRQATKPQS